MLKYIDQIIVKQFDKNIDKKKRSRILKTSFRNEIDGDLLFIDVDTVICGDLLCLDELSCSIAMALEGNDVLSKFYSINGLKNTLDKYNLKMGVGDYYFNSGVIYVKDNLLTRKFFKDWEKQYILYYEKGLTFDQGTLNHLNNIYSGLIQVLPNEYNCQCDLGLKYIGNVKILHYLGLNTFNDVAKLNFSFSKFSDKNIYEYIKSNGRISQDIQSMVENAKFQVKDGFFVSKDSITYSLIFSKCFKILRYIYAHQKKIYYFLENVVFKKI
ncbi:glycosyltransferase [Candidatus Stoquefichus sp. SB1]|uniref:glycosyltransferase n=1 Tax=Candidatus Stoquefichus sp. SB1 TaxID=1658109 RepID=UPI00067F0E1F|nr:glycosyltransferase [Candidatus Stoquefichus sp. SB1]